MKKVIVPSDFSEVADDALNYATEIARPLSAEVLLMHVLKSSITIEEAESRLEKQIARVANKEIITQVKVYQGDFLTMIPKAAKELGAELMIMGTHGKKGVQHIVGSYAMKVVHDCEMPVIIIQRNHSSNACPKNILIPLEFGEDIDAPLEFVTNVARKFKHGWDQKPSKIHIVYNSESDSEAEIFDALLNTKIMSSGLEFEKHRILSRPSEYVSAACDYAKKMDIDLICMPNMSQDKSIELISSREQKFLTNRELIPVMIFNPNLLKP